MIEKFHFQDPIGECLDLGGEPKRNAICKLVRSRWGMVFMAFPSPPAHLRRVGYSNWTVLRPLKSGVIQIFKVRHYGRGIYSEKMQYRFFTIPAISGDGAIVEEMNAFLRSHRVQTVQRELLCNGTQSYWCCCVEYLEGTGSASSVYDRFEKRDKIDYRTVLDEEAFKRFCQLREVRKMLADADANPAYTIMIDEQLAELAKLDTVDEAALKRLKGFGEKKYEKYGLRFLAVLKEKQGETKQ